MENNEAAICPLCRNESVKIFAFGECLHPVCHLCSTKMRILCEQTYCAICRQELTQVQFVSKLSDVRLPIQQNNFKPIDGTGDCGIYYDKKFEWIRTEAENLLRNFCPLCPTEHLTFEVLREHVRHHHRLFYCDLCVEHLNLFPFERKFYSRQDLIHHIRQGDRDDKSFKGHPLCKFCDDHFLDNDHLYRHMRQEHYYCHLCSTDNVYYSTFELLRVHYRNGHYLCEIGQCSTVQFTNVFANEVEFRAHQASQHSKSRAEARQLATIPVAFQVSNNFTNDRRRQQQQQKEASNRDTNANLEPRTETDNQTSRRNRDENQPNNATANIPTIDDFPALNTQASSMKSTTQRGAWSADGSRGNYSHEDFPALANAHGSSSNLLQSRGIWRESQNQSTTQKPTNAQTSTGTSTTTQKKKKASAQSATIEKEEIDIEEEFPQLKSSGPARITAPTPAFSAWSKAKSTKKASTTSNSYRPQTRMNTRRIMNGDDDDDEHIWRPMSTLTTSTAPVASSNISIISSSDLNTTQTNDKTNKNKNQSVPKPQDFPELPTTSLTNRIQKTPAAASGVWSSEANNAQTKKQEKKKNQASKKQFFDEVRSIQQATKVDASNHNPPPLLGLNDLGRRLIQDEDPTDSQNSLEVENKSTNNSSPKENNEQEKVEKTANKNKKNKKNKDNANKARETEQLEETGVSKAVKQQNSSPLENKKEKTSSPSTVIVQEKTSTTSPPPPTENLLLSGPPPCSTSSVLPAPPGFANAPNSISPPPGFNMNSTVVESELKYIYPQNYTRRNEEFKAKLFDLFDSDLNLLTEYDKFCQVYCQSAITTEDFLKFTKELFKDKLEEYLLEFIVILPDIKKQIELYAIWSREIQTKTTSPAAERNWTKKTVDRRTIYQCHLCQQIMFDSDSEEHSSHHPQFNVEFPSLPSASISLGRGKRK